MRQIKKGATSQSVYVEVLDSTSTTGGRKTGLAFNTASLTAYYVRNQGSATAITLATLAAANSAWSSGGFKEVDAANMPGVYRLDVPDASVAAGAGDDVTFTLKGATGMAQVSIGVQLLAWDPQDTVRGGLTALPNAAANAAGGLPISIAGALDLDEMNVDIEAIQTSTAGLTFTGAGKVDASVRDWIGGTIPAVNVTGVPLVDLKYTLGTISPAPAGSVRADAVTGAVGSVTGNVGGNVTGTVGSVVGAVGSVTGLTASDVGAIKTQTDKMTFTAANVMDSNMLRINGDATSAANIAKTTRAIGRGTCTTAGSSTTLIATSAFLPVGVAANTDQFAGRVITFDADTTTTKLRGQSTIISSSSAAAAPVFTVVAITIAPVDGDTFSVT